MNTSKKYKKILSGILLITCLVCAVKYSYQFFLPNVPSGKLQAVAMKIKSTTQVAELKAEASLPATVKAIQQPILSAREKYEAFLNNHPYNKVHKVNNKEVEREVGEKREEEENNPDRPDLAFEQDFIRTMNPILKRPTPELLSDIIEKNELVSANTEIKTFRMPGDNTSAATNWIERGPNNVGGRTRALTWDPTIANKVWAGGVSGGLWYNTNITDANSSWIRVDDLWASLAVTKIAFDPNNAQIAYVSTGEGFGVGKSIGGGIWKTTNGGSSWSQLVSTKTYNYINDLVVRKEGATSVIYAAVDAGNYEGTWFGPSIAGLRRSTDGGSTWTQVLPVIAGNTKNFVASSISLGAYNRIWVGSKSSPYGGTDRGGGRVLWSDDGVNWTISNTLTDATNGRVTVAAAPSDSNYVYSFTENKKGDNSTGIGGLCIIRKSVDNGVTWTDIAQPDDADNGISADDFTRTQAFYDQALMVDPNNPQTILIGGINLFRSINGGTSWAQISKWANNASMNTLNCSFVHADQHAIAFKPGSSSTAIFGTDGGIYYSSDLANSATTNSIIGRNNNFNVTQFYSAAINPTLGSNNYMAGAQDNGTQRFATDGMNATIDVSGGDGGYCFIDQLDSNFQINSFVYNNYYLSTTGGNVNSFNNKILNESTSSATSSFINPACYDNNQHALYTYKKSNSTSGGSINVVKTVTTTPTAAVIDVVNLKSAATAFKVSPYTTASTTLFIGTSAGRLIRITGANTATPVETAIAGAWMLPPAAISCIEIGSNENELLVTFFNYGISKLWYTTDGGDNWTDKSGNFPDMPIRWALFNPNHRKKEVILATELGIYGTTNFDAAAPTWSAINTGFANVRTDMLQMRNSDYQVIASTHGRGLFSSMGFSEATAPTITAFSPVNATTGATITITGTNFTNASAVSFGGSDAASFTVVNATTITAVLGGGASGYVKVITPGGEATKVGFTAITSSTSTITAFSPVNAGVGKTITITGTGFTGATAVNFGGTAAASFTIASDVSITAVVANGTSGTVTVNTPGGLALKSGFIFIPTPTITAGSATTFCTGGTVTLTSNAASGNQWYKDGVAIAGASASSYAVTTAGSYTVIVSLGDGKSAESTATVVTTSTGNTATLTSAAGSNAQIKCINTAIVNITYSTTGATSASFSGLPAGVTGSWASNSASISGTPSVSGSFNYSISFTGGCPIAGSTSGSLTILATPTAPSITSSAVSFCLGNSATLTSNTASGNNWYKDGVAISGANGVTYSATAAGIYTDTIINAGGCKVGSLPTTITIITSPTKPTVNWNGSEFSTATATSYQWFLNNVLISGAINTTFKPTAIGLYKVEISNAAGCKNESDNFNLVVTALNNPATTSVTNLASVFPNPASPVLLVKFREAPNTTLDIRLITNDGRTIQMVKTKDKLTTIPISNVPSGKYYIRITGNNYNQTEGVIISK
jgi:hypothetical protein